MRIFVGLGLVIFLGVMGYWFSRTTTDTESRALDIPLAFGTPAGTQVEMHVIVGVALANISQMKNPNLKEKNWNEWMKDHFSLKDSTGKAVTLTRQTSSKVIKAHEVAQMVGTEEFFITAPLKVGQSYTLDFISDLTTGKTYRCQFTAPSRAEKVQHYRLEPVTAGG